MTHSEFCDAVERWHKSVSDLPIHEFLGMTPEQYAFCVERPGEAFEEETKTNGTTI